MTEASDGTVQLLAAARAAYRARALAEGDRLLAEAARQGLAIEGELLLERVGCLLRCGAVGEARAALPAASAGVPRARAALWQGRVERASGHAEAALAAFTEAARLAPDDPQAWFELGLLHGSRGELPAAATAFERAVATGPGHPLHWTNLGLVRLQQGDAAGAEPCLRRALALAPADVGARTTFAACLRAQGRIDEARTEMAAALAQRPEDPALLSLAGEVEHAGGQWAEAARLHLAALARAPGDARYARLAAGALRELDRTEEARALLLGAARHGHWSLAIEGALTLSALPPDVATIERERGRFLPELEALAAAGARLAAPEETIAAVPFLLSYHGRPNRALLEGLAAFYRRVAPGLIHAARHCERYAGPRDRIRVGFISRHLYGHSIGRTSRGLIAGLDRRRFAVTALCVEDPPEDPIARSIRTSADAWHVLPPRLGEARATIEALELDVLFYQDLGMEPFTCFLAHSRLAPVQCVSFGHPDTSGIPTMDWWVSADLFEPADAQQHYSERLWRIPEVGNLAYYYRLPEVAPLPRERAGVHPGERLYVCAQSTFKVHPDYDATVGALLEADPAGVVVFVAAHAAWGERLRARLARTLHPDLMQRVRILGRLASADFQSLLAAADVVLDTTHFNGMNTSLEAFHHARPVVTLPGAMQRSRHTAGMYARMGLDDGVATDAADYVRRAVAFGRDQALREATSARIRERAHLLFEDAAVLRGFERFFEAAVEAAARAGGAGTDREG